MSTPRSEQPKRKWWRWKPRIPQAQPADVQFNRAARWLRNHGHERRPPPSHIGKKIRAQRVHLVRAGLLL